MDLPIVRPGDHVVLGLPNGRERDEDPLRQAMKDRFPGVEFTYLYFDKMDPAVIFIYREFPI